MLRLDAVNYDSATVTEVAARHGVLNLASGICKLPAPEFLLDAAMQGLGCASFVEDYDGPAGHVVGRIAVLAALRAADAELEAIDLDDVLVTPGVSYGLALVARHLRRSHHTVLVPSPTYASAGQSFRHAGFAVRPLYSRGAGDGYLGLPAVSEVCASVAATGPCVLYLNEFNNPTGQRHSPRELGELVAAVEAVDGAVVIDGITADLGRGAEPGPGIPAEPDSRRFGFAELVRLLHGRSAFVLGGLSKDRPVPGLRIGWLIGPGRDVQAIAEANLCEQPGSVGIASAVLFRDRLARSHGIGRGEAFRASVSGLLGIHCGSDRQLMSYLDGELRAMPTFGRRNAEWSRAMAEALSANLAGLLERLPDLGLELAVSPDGGYNLLVRSTEPESRDSVELCHRIFRSSGLQLMPGETLGCHPEAARRRFTTRLSLCMQPGVWRSGLLRFERALDEQRVGRDG